MIIDTNLENSLWFTGSTIAQTLSGSAGLLGAIMLFALQETSRSIAQAAVQLAEHPHPTMNAAYMHHLLSRRGFHEMARLYGDALKGVTNTGTNVVLLAHYSTLAWELDHDAKIRASFWTALKASGVMIAFSITVCGLAPGLSTMKTLGLIALLLIITGAISCLVLYGILLRALFRPPPEPSAISHQPSATES
ncbi:MAG TPA: hypothetical protein VLB00_09085 [Gemmatimonadales bacterium]|nr:hypothetical protein [Gemmatimonadales bacterium]